MNDNHVRIASNTVACLGVAAIVGSTSLFSQGKREVPIPSSILDPKLERLVVARVGPLNITGNEFKLSYEFGPAFAKREKDSKKRYLNFMMYEKLLALEAEHLGLDQWPDMKRQVSEIEGDLATEELYRHDVLGKVHISDRQLAAGMKEEQVHFSLEWLFVRSDLELNALAKEMKSGVQFDSLYDRQIKSDAKSEDRSLATTKFKLGMKNPMFANVVDTMKVGSVSLPIHGPDGWYIVKMVESTVAPVISQTDEAKLAEDVRRAMTQHISDSLSDVYVRSVVKSQNPTIMREPFNAIQAYLGNKFLTKDVVEKWRLNERKGAKDLNDVSNLEPIAAEILVKLKSKSLSVKDFLEWYRMREPYAKMELSTPQGFFNSTEELVWRMVRDRLLTRKAFARGFQNLPAVKRQTQWWREKMLYTANKNRIADTITDSLPLVRAYYDENKRSFTDANGNVKPFEAVREDVWRQYSSYAVTKKMLHEVLRLKEEYGVRIDDSALARVAVDDQADPKAIDVYTVKKGGIYPHAAFPSVDYEWQSWE